MDYEHTLLTKPHVSVYQCPPMASTKGHMMDSWKNKLENCSMKITGKGLRCEVILNDSNGNLFAKAPIPENHELAISKAIDSTRAFALKVVNPSGGSSWVGLVFRERNDAFDFQVCFEDFAKTRDMELHPEKYALENKPTKDFSLKPGEKINFNFGGSDNANPSKQKASNTEPAFRLAPPPGMGGSKPSTLPQPTSQTQQTTNFGGQQKQNTSNSNSADIMDLFSFGGSNTTVPSKPPTQSTGMGFVSQPPPPTSNTTNAFGGFGGFGDWTNTSQPSTNTSNQPKDPFAGFGSFGAPNSNNSSNSNQQNNKPTTQQVNLLDLQF